MKERKKENLEKKKKDQVHRRESTKSKVPS